MPGNCKGSFLVWVIRTSKSPISLGPSPRPKPRGQGKAGEAGVREVSRPRPDEGDRYTVTPLYRLFHQLPLLNGMPLIPGQTPQLSMAHRVRVRSKPMAVSASFGLQLSCDRGPMNRTTFLSVPINGRLAPAKTPTSLNAMPCLCCMYFARCQTRVFRVGFQGTGLLGHADQHVVYVRLQ